MITDKEQHEMLKQNTTYIDECLTRIENRLKDPKNLIHGKEKEAYGFFLCANSNDLIFANRVEEFTDRFNEIFVTLEDR